MHSIGRCLVLAVLPFTLVACGSSSGKSKDNTAPVITLLGDNPQVILAGTPYVELGATALDNIDGDISGSVVIDTTGVDLSLTGSYPVTYDVIDSAGNPATTITRSIRVLVTGEWRQTGSMFNQRAWPRAALLNDGRVLIVGGEFRTQPFPNQAEIYDPATGEFALAGEIVADEPVVLLDGRVLIVNGETGAGPDPSSIYDPVAGAFRAIGALNHARRGFSVTLLNDGRVLVVGGEDWLPDCEILVSAEVFDPVTETFTLVGSMSVPRSGHTATLLNDGKVLIAGGRSTEICDPFYVPPTSTLSSAELFDPVTGTFASTGSMPDVGVLLNTASLLPDGNVLVVVGTEGWEGQKNAVYDVASGTFEPAGAMTDYRGLHAAVALRSNATCDGPVMVVGGAQGPINSLSSVELYDQELGSFYSTGDLPEERAGGHTAILLQDGRVLVAGGFYYDGNDEPIPRGTASIFEPTGGCP